MDVDILNENLKVNCIPKNILSINDAGYEDFLLERRKLMARKIKDYYKSL